MAGFTQMSFSPASGLNDRDAYPTTPVSEGEARSAVQGISDQIKDYINKVLLQELQNAETEKSGAEKIGSAEIADVTGTTIRDQLISIKDIAKTVVAGGLSPNIVETQYINNGAVTKEKIADYSIDSNHFIDGSIDNEHLSENCINGMKIADASIDSGHLVVGSIDAAHLSEGCVTEEKISGNAITKLKLHAETRAMIPSLNEGIGTFSAGQNLDTYLTVGTYVCLSDATAAGLVNCPATLAFKLFVDYARGQSDYIVQICRDRTGNQFIRSKAPNESWTSWVRQATVIFGTSATPPAGIYPAGTLYIQYQA